MIYLATPYSHPDPQVRHERFFAAVTEAAERTARGVLCYSPIAHSHHIAQLLSVIPHDLEADPGSFDAWRNHSLDMLRRCDSMEVVMMDGWRESIGIAGEIQYAEANGIIVEYAEPLPEEWLTRQAMRSNPRIILTPSEVEALIGKEAGPHGGHHHAPPAGIEAEWPITESQPEDPKAPECRGCQHPHGGAGSGEAQP